MGHVPDVYIAEVRTCIHYNKVLVLTPVAECVRFGPGFVLILHPLFLFFVFVF